MEGPYWYTSGRTTQTRRNINNSGEVQEPTDEDEASKGLTDNVIRNFTSGW